MADISRILIDISTQSLSAYDGEILRKSYSVSTSKYGVGELKDSYQTPRGAHIVRAKIGQNLPINTHFVGRRPTGKIYNQNSRGQHPNCDWVLTRIMWLQGSEIGKNRLGNVDTMQRYIYIHGTPDEEPMGVPHSHGCIRMRNKDIIELFDMTPINCPVLIIDQKG